MIFVIDQFNPERSWSAQLDEYLSKGPSSLPEWVSACQVEWAISQLGGEPVKHTVGGVAYIVTDPDVISATPACMRSEVFS